MKWSSSPQMDSFSVTSFPAINGVLTIYMERPEFWLENQMVRIILFGTFSKLWASSCVNTLIVFPSIWSVQLDHFLTGIYFVHKAKISYEMFTHEIPNWMVCANGKHPKTRVKKETKPPRKKFSPSPLPT